MEKAEVLKVLQHIGSFNEIAECQNPVFKKRKLGFGFSFTDTIERFNIKILVGFEINFPLVMPTFFIDNYGSLPLIPHVEKDGKVCYTHEDYTFIDFEQPGQIISETYLLTKKTIEEGLKKKNLQDFADEFEAYWARLDNCEEIYSDINISADPIIIKIGKKENFRFAVSDETQRMKNVSRYVNLDEIGITYQNAIFIPFTINDVFLPPRYHDSLGIDYFQSILKLLTAPAEKKLSRLFSTTTKNEEYVIFSFPQKNNVHCLFGVKFSNFKSTGHPLISNDFAGKITPISFDRLDKEFLYKRGGNGEAVPEKKVLLIGGGSIGGFIGEELIRNGFFDLTVVDADFLKSVNCYRHLTGFAYVGKNKAKAIKEKTESFFPHSNVNAIDIPIEEALRKKVIRIEDYHFIIVATGNVTVNCFLNKLLSKFNKPILYTWNDPYGIGGHCLVTNLEKKGCYNCLYTNDEFYNMASFAHHKQDKTFLKTLSGCGSVYTPYGSIDSMQTAILTVKTVIEIETNRIKQNAIYSWKGNSEIFIREGYKTSSRYEMGNVDLEERKNSFANEKCKVCN
ncbi:MAG: E2/UBC family protein [Bacteroidota bacterium]|nr:E2/UBC family protein [Bacteroidota bacterium]